MILQSAALRGALTLCVLASASPLDAAPAGSFDSGKTRIEIVGEYAFWGKTAGFSDGQVIKVAVSNGDFVAQMFDPWYDKKHTIDTFFADAETKVVYFEFEPTGKYKGYSFYFVSGDGCGYCYDSSVRSTVAASGGRLKGKISHQDPGNRRAFDIDIDVPIPDASNGTALPRDGGDPGRVYLAYHKALNAGDKAAILALLDARNKRHWAEHDKAKNLDGWIRFKYNELHGKMNNVSVVGGYAKDDHAVILFTGSSGVIDRMYGEAVLRREGGAWLFEDEWTDVGARP
jgi:hypothetical protein